MTTVRYLSLFLAAAAALLLAPAAAFTTHKIPDQNIHAAASGRSYTQVLGSDAAAAADNAAPSPSSKGGKSSSSSLVAVNQNNIEFGAGTLGAGLGLFLGGGPVLAALLGGATNYLARKDVDAASDAVKGVSSKAIEAYNYVANLLIANDVSGKIKSSVGNSNPETLDTLESTWKTVSDKADEYAVIELAGRALGITGDALEKVVDAALAYADENGVADKVKAASSDAIGKAKELAAEQAR